MKKMCSFPECDRKHVARGYCGGHWRQWRLGQKLRKLRVFDSQEDRVLSWLDTSGGPDSCWLFKGGASGKSTKKGGGYGRISYMGKRAGIHRIAYEIWVGPIPENMEIDHMCGNSLCANPKHLRPLSKRDNLKAAAYHKSLEKEVRRLQKLILELGGNYGADFLA